MTYARNPENLADVAQDPRYHFVRGDIADPQAVDGIFERGFYAIVHFAAETHVDRSIEDASPFLKTNILGTHTLLEATRRFPAMRFIHSNTDEVYGSAPAGVSFTEEATLTPRSPHAASKASAEHLVTAYINTYRVPAVILRCTNNYGPSQFPEKLIRLMIANASEERPPPIYGGLQERDWLFVENHCRAIALALDNAKPGSVCNVSSGVSLPNLKVVRTILQHRDKPESLIQYVEDRSGHDRRYGLDSSKIQSELGWAPTVSLEEGLHRTIEWYQVNAMWLDHTRRSETFRT